MPRSPRAATIALLLASAAGLAPFLALVPYAHPQNDDWVMAVSTLQGGVLGATQGWLKNWGGRYSALLANMATPLAAGSLEGWRAAIAAYMLVLPVGISLLVCALAPRSTRPVDRLAVGAALSAVVYAGMPNPAGGLYWMNGVTCYGVGEGIALAAFALVLEGERPGARRPWAWTSAAAVLAAIGVGTNEAIALLLVCSTGVALAYAAVRRRPWVRIAVVLAVSIAALAVVLLMPGTRARIASHGASADRDLLHLLGRAASVCARSALAWSVTTPLVPAALLLGMGASRARASDTSWSLPHPVLLGGVAALAFLGTALAPLYGQGEIPSHTMNLVHAVFAGGVLLTGAGTGAWIAGRRPGAARAPGWALVAGAAVAVALAAIPGSALRGAWSDLATGRAGRFDGALRARYDAVARCPLAWCEVPRIPDPPRTLVWFEDAVDEATDSPFFLRYKSAYAAYFGKARIRLAPSAP